MNQQDALCESTNTECALAYVSTSNHNKFEVRMCGLDT